MNILDPHNKTEKAEELLPFKYLSRLKDSLREKLDPSDDPESAEQMRGIIEIKVRHLKNSYTDYRNFQTFYLLAGQNIPTTVTKVDFPGDDSIIAFIENF